jgi:hypothetical protein
MTTVIYILLLVAVWVALNAWILPKLGLQT